MSARKLRVVEEALTDSVQRFEAVDEPLRRATAVLELLFALVSSHSCADSHLSELGKDTLSTMTWTVTEWSSAAREAAGKLHDLVRDQKGAP